MSVNSGLKATKIIGQRKAFYRQRVPEFSRARKETADIEILVTSRNGDRKLMQSIGITSRIQFQVATRSTSQDMTTVFHAWPCDRFIDTEQSCH